MSDTRNALEATQLERDECLLALSTFAAMARDGDNPETVVCERGCGSDMTLVTNGDWRAARDLLDRFGFDEEAREATLRRLALEDRTP